MSLTNNTRGSQARLNVAKSDISPLKPDDSDTIENTASGFQIIKPNIKKQQKLNEIAKKEEIEWKKFQEANRLKSVHEIHRLGGNVRYDNINEAREKFIKHKVPTKIERLEKQKIQHSQWKQKEDDEIEEMRKKQREKAEFNEVKEKIRQMEIKEEIEIQRTKFISKIEQQKQIDKKSGTNNHSISNMNNNERSLNSMQHQKKPISSLNKPNQNEIRLARENYFNKIF